MTKKIFDWHKYLANVTYAEARLNSPELPPVPTIYSPDHSYLYLSSLDQQIKTDNLQDLMWLQNLLKEAYALAIEGTDHKKISRIKTDHREVCALLGYLVENPEKYSDPDEFLESS